MLTAGENSVKFATLDGSDGPNIDQFDVTLVKAAIDTSGTDAVPLFAGASLLSNVCDVSIYGIDGRFVRSQKNFPQSSLRNSGELLSGLRAGVYLVRTTAPGAYRQFFAAAK